jgi:hypothetical protein
MVETIEDALGKDFAEKYKEALTKTRIKKLDVSGETKNQIIEYIKKYMRPEEASMIYRKNEHPYHVILAETIENQQIFPTKYGFRAGLKWQGNWITCWLQEADAQLLNPSTPYFLIGKLECKDYKGRDSWTIGVHGIISMKEVVDYVAGKEKQTQEINEKILEHKE